MGKINMIGFIARFADYSAPVQRDNRRMELEKFESIILKICQYVIFTRIAVRRKTQHRFHVFPPFSARRPAQAIALCRRSLAIERNSHTSLLNIPLTGISFSLGTA